MTLHRLLGAAVGALVAALAARGEAEPMPVAPGLAVTTAHKIAEGELAAIVAKVPEESRAKIRGVYVAFDPNPNDASAVAACDDDGDYVVAVTDAMVNVADYVAQAMATDEVFHTHKVDDYAAFVAHGQVQDARILPPPAGFFDATQARDANKLLRESARFRQILGAIVAHEVAHMTAGDLVCPHPTATHERGDDTWTRAEAKAAFEGAAKIYTAPRVLTADASATDWLLTAESDAGGKEHDAEAAYVALLSFFHKLGGVTYAREHHVADVPSTSSTSARVAVVHAAAAEWRITHASK